MACAVKTNHGWLMDLSHKSARATGLLGIACVLGFCPLTSLHAAYLTVVGPAPLRWLAPAPPAVLVALPPLDSGKPKPATPTLATAAGAAGTPFASHTQPTVPPSQAPPGSPLDITSTPGSSTLQTPNPGAGAAATEPPTARIEPPIPSAQLFLPFFRNDGAGDKPPGNPGHSPAASAPQGGVIVPFQFNPPTPFRPPSSTATYSSKP